MLDKTPGRSFPDDPSLNLGAAAAKPGAGSRLWCDMGGGRCGAEVEMAAAFSLATERCNVSLIHPNRRS